MFNHKSVRLAILPWGRRAGKSEEEESGEYGQTRRLRHAIKDVRKRQSLKK